MFNMLTKRTIQITCPRLLPPVQTTICRTPYFPEQYNQIFPNTTSICQWFIELTTERESGTGAKRRYKGKNYNDGFPFMEKFRRYRMSRHGISPIYIFHPLLLAPACNLIISWHLDTASLSIIHSTKTRNCKMQIYMKVNYISKSWSHGKKKKSIRGVIYEITKYGCLWASCCVMIVLMTFISRGTVALDWESFRLLVVILGKDTFVLASDWYTFLSWYGCVKIVLGREHMKESRGWRLVSE